MSSPLPHAASLHLGERLGQGAVATVYRVHGPAERQWAGKVLHASHEHDDAAAARFAQEAELLEGLSHEHLVRVYGRARVDGRTVLLMELVTGPTLAELVAREGPLPAARVRTIGRGIADGLAYAHRAGIVHRDLKPSNVMLAAGDVAKIADFGMARATSLAGVDRGALTVLGTPDYMAPECLDPLAVDARADLYALGCILFELLTGHPPYSAATPLGVLAAHRDRPIPSLPGDVPAPLRELVEALLAKSPGDRPQAAAAVRDALDGMQPAAGPSTALVPVSPSAGALAIAGRCVACGAPLVVPLGVCTDCGHEIAHLEQGDHTVLVVGPGQPGDKLDATLRERLRRWIDDNPSLGLVAGNELVKTIPRLPFPLTGKVSRRSADSVVAALQRLGLEAQAVHGGPLASPLMRNKTRTLLGRAALIVLGMSSGLWNAGWGVLILLAALVVAAGVMVAGTLRRVTRDTGGTAAPLPGPVQQALERTRRGLAAIEERRHRQGLRAVISRVVDLARGVPPDDTEAAEELARASDAALAAAARLDELDRRLVALPRDASSKEARELLHARDTWASRLLSLTATLDTLATRRAAAGARKGLADEQEQLEALRAHVEALEEVQRA